MHTDLATLKERVLAATKASALNSRVEEIVVESDRDDEGTDFLRVILRVKHGGPADDREFEALLEAIEDAVSAVDQRYPSVRFSEAA